MSSKLKKKLLNHFPPFLGPETERKLIQPPVVRKKQPPPAISYSISGAAISQVLEKNFLANSESGACSPATIGLKIKNFCVLLLRKSYDLILKILRKFVKHSLN
jgi:hypothetical protein